MRGVKRETDGVLSGVHTSIRIELRMEFTSFTLELNIVVIFSDARGWRLLHDFCAHNTIHMPCFITN